MSTPITLDSLSILDDLFIPPTDEEKEDSGERYIINEKRIDKLTVKRDRVKLTPAVCDECGFDVLDLAFRQNKLSTNKYDELSDNIKLLMEQAVQKHKSLTHSESERLITTSRPKKWLSGRAV